MFQIHPKLDAALLKSLLNLSWALYMTTSLRTISWNKQTNKQKNQLISTVKPAKRDSDVMFYLQSYEGLIIDRSPV